MSDADEQLAVVQHIQGRYLARSEKRSRLLRILFDQRAMPISGIALTQLFYAKGEKYTDGSLRVLCGELKSALQTYCDGGLIHGWKCELPDASDRGYQLVFERTSSGQPSLDERIPSLDVPLPPMEGIQLTFPIDSMQLLVSKGSLTLAVRPTHHIIFNIFSAIRRALHYVWRKNLSPEMVDDEFLDTEIVMLLQGFNRDGERIYSYLQINGMNIRLLFTKMRDGHNFSPNDYGTVLAAGSGEPDDLLVAEMNSRYQMVSAPSADTVMADILAQVRRTPL